MNLYRVTARYRGAGMDREESPLIVAESIQEAHDALPEALIWGVERGLEIREVVLVHERIHVPDPRAQQDVPTSEGDA